MASILTAYAGATPTAITASIQGLANGAAWQSAAVLNNSTAYLDALVAIQTKGTSASTATLDVFVSAAIASTSPVFTDSATGSDGTFANISGTPAAPPNSVFLGSVVMNGVTSVVSAAYSVADKFGGTMPVEWVLVFVNNSGGALDSTGANHIVSFQGISGSVS